MLAEAETKLLARVDNSIEAVVLEAGTDTVELRFVEIRLDTPESIDLGFDSVLEVANEPVQLFEIVAEIAQVDAEVGPAAAWGRVPETAEAPEVGAHAGQQGDLGAVLVDLAGLRGQMEALSACVEMARNQHELLRPIDFGIVFPQAPRPVLEPVEVVKSMIALAEEAMAGMTSQKSAGPGIALVEMVVPPGKVVHFWWKLPSENN